MVTIELMRAISAAFNSRDVERIVACFADDGVFCLARGPESVGRTLKGKAAIRKALSDRFRQIPDMRWENEEYILAEDRAISFCQTISRRRPPGSKPRLRRCGQIGGGRRRPATPMTSVIRKITKNMKNSICAILDAVATRLEFIFSDPRQFGIGEHAEGDETAAGGAIAPVKVRMNDAEIVVTNVGELRAAGAIGHRPDIFGGGLQAIVDLDVAVGVKLNSGALETDVLGIGSSTGCHQEVAPFDGAIAARIIHLQSNAVA